LTDGRFVTVFEEGDEFNGLNDNGIEVRISNADGTNGGSISVTEINNTSDSNAKVSGLTDGGFVVAWVETEETNGSFNNNIKYRVYNADGSPRTAVLTAADTSNNHSGVDVIGMEDGTFFLAWEDSTFSEIEGQLYSASGALVGGEIDIAATGTPVNPELGTTSDGRILVTYQTLTGGNDVQFKILDPRDSIITAEPGDGQTTGHVTGTVIIGSDENDILLGQGGNDTFQFVQAATSSTNIDSIDGGGGVNTFEITNLNAKRIIDLQAGLFGTGDINGMDAIRGTFANIQNVTVAGAQDVRGDGNANVLTAVGNFANAFEGGGGADTLDGGAGNDTLRGGAGGDTYNNVEAGDLLVELLNEGYDIVNKALTAYTLGANFDRLNYTGSGNFVGTGNNLSNRFSGNVGNDRFVDTFGGSDIFSGGQGYDVVDFRTAATGATINFVTSTMGGSAAGDTFSSIEGYWGSNTAGDQMTALAGNLKFYGFGGNDTLNGGTGADLLSGGNGNDSLSGGGNVDNIQGGLGNDTKNGGAGADLFVYVEAAFGQDLINDFTDGSDRLKVFSAVANDITDFTILGNGGTFVALFLNANASQTITLLGAAPITLTAADFVFY
jgi:Ca2+-binding RTX toxin-like protein